MVEGKLFFLPYNAQRQYNDSDTREVYSLVTHTTEVGIS